MYYVGVERRDKEQIYCFKCSQAVPARPSVEQRNLTSWCVNIQFVQPGCSTKSSHLRLFTVRII